MTLLVKCDGCGKVQEAGKNGSNPFDDKTGSQWYSRYNKDLDKEVHACSRECMKDGGPVWPL